MPVRQPSSAYFFCLILVATIRGHSATFWVAPTGQNTAQAGPQATPFATLSYACSQASPGDTIRLTGGQFLETAQTVLKSGQHILGSGRAGVGASVVNAPASWDYSADEWTENVAGYVVRIQDVQGGEIAGIQFRGNSNKANGAIHCTGSRDINVHDVDVYDFRYYGIHFTNSSRVQLHDAYIENSGFEQGKKAGSVLPDGGSLGNLGIHGVSHGIFHDISIKTTALHGYGMKMSSVDTCEFYRMSFDMYPFQSWNSPIGSPGAGNFDFENHGGHIRMTSFHHNRFTATISIMGGSGAIYDDVDYSVHLHHNLFDLGGDYGIELGTDKMVVDHNYFRDTWACMQNFGHAETRIIGLTFCHNICENIGMRVIGSGGKLDFVRFFNNTVLMANDGWQGYLFTQEYENGSRNWSIVNNIISGDPQAAGNQIVLSAAYGGATNVRGIYAGNNCYTNAQMAVQGDSGAVDATTWDYVFAGNINRDAGLPLTGTKPDQAFIPDASDPVVDSGDSLWGMVSAYAGTSRDIGACELGQNAWTAGPTSADTCLYVWAPLSSVTQEYFVDSLRADLRTNSAGAQIRYTLDGTEPNRSSALYTGPVLVNRAVKFRARAFKDGWASATAFIRDFAEGVQGYPNLAASGTCTASSVYPEMSSQGGYIYSCEKALDGDTHNWIGWSPDAGDVRPWLMVDLGAAYTVKYVELYTRAQTGNDETARRNFAIQGSNDPDFATSTVLASQGSTALPFEGVFKSTVAVTTKFRYVRAIKTVDNEGFFITELRILCETGAPVVSPRTPAKKAPPRIVVRSLGQGRVVIGHVRGQTIEVLSMDGRRLFRGQSRTRDDLTIGPMGKGIYLLRCAGRSTLALIR